MRTESSVSWFVRTVAPGFSRVFGIAQEVLSPLQRAADSDAGADVVSRAESDNEIAGGYARVFRGIFPAAR
jgi:hypothetical protein